MTTDEQLVEAAIAGSAGAFETLVERYRVRLLRFLLGRCASRADAEDAVQDTLVAAYRYLASFNPRWRFSTWIYRIAIRNAARQSQRHAPLEAGEPVDDADPLADCIDATDRENLWLTARRVLSEDAYAALWLRYVEDLSVGEVAQALERSPSWTKVTLLRARRRLGREMAGEVA